MAIKKEPSKRIKDICDSLRLDGQRITPQRLAIIDMALNSRSHPTAKGIHEALIERFPTMSLMTVYKTLHLLHALGELSVIGADPERAHYDGFRPEPHPHLVCGQCGAIADAGWPQASEWLAPARRQGWQIQSWRLELLGLCPTCRTGVHEKHEGRTNYTKAFRVVRVIRLPYS